MTNRERRVTDPVEDRVELPFPTEYFGKNYADYTTPELNAIKIPVDLIGASRLRSADMELKDLPPVYQFIKQGYTQPVALWYGNEYKTDRGKFHVNLECSYWRCQPRLKSNMTHREWQSVLEMFDGTEPPWDVGRDANSIKYAATHGFCSLTRYEYHRREIRQLDDKSDSRLTWSVPASKEELVNLLYALPFFLIENGKIRSNTHTESRYVCKTEQGPSREEKQFFALEYEEVRIFPFSASLSGKYISCGVSCSKSDAYGWVPRIYLQGAKEIINEFAMMMEWFLLQAFGLPFSALKVSGNRRYTQAKLNMRKPETRQPDADAPTFGGRPASLTRLPVPAISPDVTPTEAREDAERVVAMNAVGAAQGAYESDDSAGEEQAPPSAPSRRAPEPAAGGVAARESAPPRAASSSAATQNVAKRPPVEPPPSVSTFADRAMNAAQQPTLSHQRQASPERGGTVENTTFEAAEAEARSGHAGAMRVGRDLSRRARYDKEQFRFAYRSPSVCARVLAREVTEAGQRGATYEWRQVDPTFKFDEDLNIGAALRGTVNVDRQLAHGWKDSDMPPDNAMLFILRAEPGDTRRWPKLVATHIDHPQRRALCRLYNGGIYAAVGCGCFLCKHDMLTFEDLERYRRNGEWSFEVAVDPRTNHQWLYLKARHAYRRCYSTTGRHVRELSFLPNEPRYAARRRSTTPRMTALLEKRKGWHGRDVSRPPRGRSPARADGTPRRDHTPVPTDYPFRRTTLFSYEGIADAARDADKPMETPTSPRNRDDNEVQRPRTVERGRGSRQRSTTPATDRYARIPPPAEAPEDLDGRAALGRAYYFQMPPEERERVVQERMRRLEERYGVQWKSVLTRLGKRYPNCFRQRHPTKTYTWEDVHGPGRVNPKRVGEHIPYCVQYQWTHSPHAGCGTQLNGDSRGCRFIHACNFVDEHGELCQNAFPCRAFVHYAMQWNAQGRPPTWYEPADEQEDGAMNRDGAFAPGEYENRR